VVLIFIAAFIVPWWLTIIMAAVGVGIRLLSLELLVIGVILDLFLIPEDSGLFGFFFAPIFLVILLVHFTITALKR
jgi:hypothetical protein